MRGKMVSVQEDWDNSLISEVFEQASFNLEDDILKNAHLILKDMDRGLAKLSSSLAMQDSKCCLSKMDVSKIYKKDKIIAIDLGGSNLRSSLILFDGGKLEVGQLQVVQCKKEYDSYETFFEFIAKNIEYLKDKACKIAFCFSYALDFLKEGEAVVASLSKDLSVPDIEGKNVGNELLRALRRDGWKGVESIFVTNDTLATLFAGLYKKLQVQHDENQYIQMSKNDLSTSFMSIILGTGLNAAYFARSEDDAIILEAGAFDKIARSDFDEMVIKESKENHHHILEKQCSAHYLGAIALKIFDVLIAKGAFSPAFKLVLDSKRRDFGNWVFLNALLDHDSKQNTIMQKNDVCISQYDKNVMRYVAKQLMWRVANLLSSLIVAIAMKMKNDRGGSKRLFAVMEGSTILKTCGMQVLLKQKVSECLQEIGGVEVEFLTCEHATLSGSAILMLLL